MIRHTGLLASALLCLWAASARADVTRFALLMGNNRGLSDDQPLRYAEADAQRMRDVLRRLGGFEPADTILLQGENADTARASLISLNARIRQRMASPDAQVIFLVYFSGHADANSLHLGSSRLDLRELKELVRGSAASFRIAVLDACRSGELTRSKGGRRVEPFPLDAEAHLTREGLAFLTASSADEDAQESDLLGASFFTHALVSGLLGAADANGDGTVVLHEAYRHAYETTLRATSRTWSGTQHPTFRYEFHGQGDLVLTRPGRDDPDRAHVHAPAGMDSLVMRGDERGPVVAEVLARSARRMLSLPAGRYFVRVRGDEILYEGTVQVAPGASVAIRPADLSAIEYAKLVRKGGSVRRTAHALELGASVRTALPNSETPCFGGVLGYGLDLEHVGFRARASLCRATAEAATVAAAVMAYGISARIYHARDLGPLAVELGLGPGLSLFQQHFETQRRATDRTGLFPYLAVGAGAQVSLASQTYVGLDLEAQTHLLVLDDGSAGRRERRVGFALRAALMAGWRL